jgi:hypothetical protein
MAITTVGHGGFAREKITAWQQTQTWNKARRRMTRQFLAQGAVNNFAFTAAWTSHYKEAAKLTALVALERLGQLLDGKIKEAAEVDTSLKTLVDPESVVEPHVDITV